MQTIEKTIDAGEGKTVNVYGPAWHSGRTEYVERKQWARIEGCCVKVFSDTHKGAKKTVRGFRATVGNGYNATIATAHRRKDLVLWIAAQSGLGADCIKFY